MNKADWQKLAVERLADAKTLLAANRWSAAYYLAGYAVEGALKACVLGRLVKEPELLFVDRKLSDKCWTHDLVQLVELAGLKADLDANCAANPEFLNRWNIVRDWNESSRYRRASKADSEELYEAITHKKHGVLSWIKAHW